MLRIHEIKIPAAPTEETEAALKKQMEKLFRGQPAEYAVTRRSLDARERDRLFFILTADVSLGSEKKESAWLRSHPKLKAELVRETVYRPPLWKGRELPSVTVVGAGPAGFFAALILARAGLSPLLIEQGAPVEERREDVEAFWEGGALKPWSNVQFGEGGAGTFSDGKLNSGIRDKEGRIAYMLDTLIEAGADPSIRVEAKPHIGTDKLFTAVQGLRRLISGAGGRILYHTRFLEPVIRSGRIAGFTAEDTKSGRISRFDTDVLVLAPGHSARESFRTLSGAGLKMEAKAFAMGLRIQHPQALINAIRYGKAAAFLPPADYKLTARTRMGRGVYSFCMCPGGYVVNASSSAGHLCVNGMSYAARDGKNANAALAVQISPADFGGGLFAGKLFQEKLEADAFLAAGGAVPMQRLTDFAGGGSALPGSVEPAVKGRTAWSDLSRFVPALIAEPIKEVMPVFDRHMPGFAMDDALLCGVESRTSSPLRLIRNAEGESSIGGIFPCGEGAGYAGGITSAAVDGIRTAEAVLKHLERTVKGVQGC